jgi:hypothetical protein
MVDAPEEGIVETRSLLERPREAPQKMIGYVLETTKTYVVHVLGLVKLFWPKAIMGALADGIAADCSKVKFTVP